MIANVVMAALISAAGVSSSDNLVNHGRQPSLAQRSLYPQRRQVSETALEDGFHLQRARTGDGQENVCVERERPTVCLEGNGTLQWK